MATLSPVDQRWYSAHQPILFGADEPFYPQGYTSVVDDGNGNARFTLWAGPYPLYEDSKQFWVKDGIYSGFHNVISYDTFNGYVYTDTPFIGNDPVGLPPIRPFFQIVPFGYRVYYGYPTPTNFFEVRAFTKPDATAFVDISSLLVNSFPVSAPANGFDETLYTYFQIDYVALGAFATFLTNNALTINAFTGWNYLSQIYYCLNSTIAHEKLQVLVDNFDWIAETEPIFAANCCNVLTKIVDNRAFNYIVCPEGTDGIGAMEIENNFIVS